MDRIDNEIIEILRANCKLSTRQISKKTKIPITTVHNRIKKLKQNGIITRFTIDVDHKKLGKPLTMYVTIQALSRTPDGKNVDQSEIAKEILKNPNVEKVDIITGDKDLLVAVRVKDIDELNNVIMKHIREIPGVDKTISLLVLQEHVRK